MKAVIDRFEGDHAVVLFGDDELKVDIPQQLLPQGAQEGPFFFIKGATWLEKLICQKILKIIDKYKNISYNKK